MTNIYELKNRLLVPNWRDFKRTIKLGELGLLNEDILTTVDNSLIINDWLNNKTIGVAADLINNSFISNDLYSNELQEAITYIESNSKDASIPLLSLIEKIKIELNPKLEDSNKILEKNIESVEEFSAFLDDKIFNRIINKTKKLTINQSSNSINWIELARLYTIKNQLDKANKCIAVALQLSPNNRFVLRSAVRFFIHTSQEEKAIYYLKKSNAIKEDPWLISAHIATSRLIDRYSPFIKIGEKIIISKKYSDFDLTELSSSLGTIELEHGSFKKSKPLLDLSLKNPNDNSLAQFEWLTKKDNRLLFNSEAFNSVKNPFEAFAYENFQKGNFQESFYNCINWYLDFPYSKRPLVFGSYIAALLEQYDASIIMCLAGLRLNSNEVGFINNIIYALCLQNKLEEVPKYLSLLNKNNMHGIDDEERITIQATLGLYHIRIKEFDKGKMFYKKAIENSNILKNEYYYNLALINFTRELYLIRDSEFSNYKVLFNNINSIDKDIMLLKSNVNKIISSDFLLI
jgi:tetratricopeptide (TPR) repeat protein